MTTSPAKRHLARVRAAQAAATAAPGQSLRGASHYELMLVKLDTDKRRLKSIQSVARKIDVKREVLPEYDAYVKGALEGGRGGQDDVLMTVMIWRIDAGDYAGALDIARYALHHRLTLPDQYERSTAAAIAEEFAEGALSAAKSGATVDGEQLVEVAQLTESADMHDQIRAKLHKAIGLAFAPPAALEGGAVKGVDRPRTEFALDHLRRALQYDAAAGVKTNVARLEKVLSDATSPKAGRK
jgi:hypothetical protein